MKRPGARASKKSVKAAIERNAKSFTKQPQHINLQNPVGHHFETFIVGNATVCQRIPRHAQSEECGDECSRMVEQDTALGQTLILCGAGPSLRDHAHEWCPRGDQVWGCNSAMTWLYENGHKVTHGFTVDQTPQMCNEWMTVPPVDYMLASSVHPHLVEMLISAGHRTTFFHNYVGIDKPPVTWDDRVMDYEDWLYSALWPPTMRAGSGLNSVTRAIDVATFMGFEHIVVLGADCALRKKSELAEGVVEGSPEHLRWLEQDTEMHADGGSAVVGGQTATTMDGEIDGRTWLTKPDLIISAVFMVKQRRRLKPGRLEFIGDTLPNALKDKPHSYLVKLPTMIDVNGVPIMAPDD